MLAHPLVQVEAIQNAGFSVVDGVNSTGGIAILPLLGRQNVIDCIVRLLVISS